jgi:hypothetical protein
MFIGRSLPLIDDIITRVQTPDIRLLGGETIDDVKSAFASQIDEGVANLRPWTISSTNSIENKLRNGGNSVAKNQF